MLAHWTFSLSPAYSSFSCVLHFLFLSRLSPSFLPSLGRCCCRQKACSRREPDTGAHCCTRSSSEIFSPLRLSLSVDASEFFFLFQPPHLLCFARSLGFSFSVPRVLSSSSCVSTPASPRKRTNLFPFRVFRSWQSFPVKSFDCLPGSFLPCLAPFSSSSSPTMPRDPELSPPPSSSSSPPFSSPPLPSSSAFQPCMSSSAGVACAAPRVSSSPLFRPPASFSPALSPGVCCVAPWASPLATAPLSGVRTPGAPAAFAAVEPATGREEDLRACKKQIHSLHDLSVWTAGPSYQAFMRFLRRLSAAVVDRKAVSRREGDSGKKSAEEPRGNSEEQSADESAGGSGEKPEENSGEEMRVEDAESATRRRAAAAARAIVEWGVRENSREGKSLHASANVLILLEILETLKIWIEEIPLIEQPMRFGNRAFRTWVDRLQERSKSLLEPLVPTNVAPPPASLSIEPIPEQEELVFPPSSSSPSSAESPAASACLQGNVSGQKIGGEAREAGEDDEAQTGKTLRETLLEELTDYLCHAFGDRQRIDYGTGHEVSFALFLFVLFEAKILDEHADDAAAVLLVFAQYVEVCHALQKTYSLEPAGSRGAWGLDDFHFLPFLFGAAQLVENHFIHPAEVVDMGVVKEFAPSNLYFSSIEYTMEVKKGAPFSECAPMLYDISGVSTWRKIHAGLLKMYEGEVLNKFPIAQHLLFGKYFPFSRKAADV
ncbi:phosphotyrosyl phosphate activator (ptpa) protein [Toxoplasma gondii ME49]|uniref:Serine/threonine-protein phosphatase 2A activator n=1 Tax=Toxoplasma gondii (strain ATCC 50611 / Me49) TaxID=508771 RepID=S8GQX3_TOXGM|nr:phosphotyrosyl phosphate activator (ptpa) protein [Toxoplasma gondii ME49]EPT30944.1 phosphotyrosyl phosphate activator (ptpa) protein [Toxoplasma gondii ME49]|eukprot:XP_002369121.2 phosphotyrosyl phosphate activator (ptpa) protein [Toxoplasma gondii ME49]